MGSLSSGKKLAFIGCGSMGSAILSGLLEASADGHAPISSFSACVRSDQSVKKLQSMFSSYQDRLSIRKGDLVATAQDADVIILAVKPYMLREVLGAAGMGDAVRGKLVLSVLAGIPPSQILDALYKSTSTDPAEPEPEPEPEAPPPCHVVQATLNLAARIRQCTTVLNDATLLLPHEELSITQWVFSQIGSVRYLPAAMMPVAATLAATPAILSLALDGMLDGAVAQGVVRAQAREIAALNLLGLAKLLLDGGVGTEELREATSSPRGVTIQALLELERRGARAAFADAFIKASEHARGMAAVQD
ncbi:pyrroline-5-carboxylate reductase [Cyphellophora europaea CBS 101466]|uniref:Pyrroline-5-carboxylate reductase n=1 Tax=Cyphellophora europaea (strain CBS 101466) TaxID=1220924 RepID=W2RY49_CYPE1|nr:pyrroline-5-carboxylate reductase [Cyphellophora europaea CBS 101466]ETN40604.1 pyrroline-5-carboxylate reductase [Cyphellophora europaea CBS 101466]